jgi:hypothetical protein
MSALLVAVGALALWTFVGLGILSALRADFQSLLLVLTAPALGLSALTIAVFLLSRAGLPVRDFALPLTAGSVLLAATALALRRPRLPASALPVAIMSIVAIAVTAEPMLTFGFDWIANANDDMTHSSTTGFSAPLDVRGLINGGSAARCSPRPAPISSVRSPGRAVAAGHPWLKRSMTA